MPPKTTKKKTAGQIAAMARRAGKAASRRMRETGIPLIVPKRYSPYVGDYKQEKR